MGWVGGHGRMTREQCEELDAREVIRRQCWDTLLQRERDSVPNSLVSQDSEDIVPKTKDTIPKTKDEQGNVSDGSMELSRPEWGKGPNELSQDIGGSELGDGGSELGDGGSEKSFKSPWSGLK